MSGERQRLAECFVNQSGVEAVVQEVVVVAALVVEVVHERAGTHLGFVAARVVVAVAALVVEVVQWERTERKA